MSMKSRIALFLLMLGIVSAAPIFAGSAAIGTVAGSLNATIGGQALLPNSTIFSGDQLQIEDGAAVIAFANGSRMALGQHTQAQFLREENGVSVELAEGNVSMYHPAQGANLEVNVEKWAITPGQGFKTVGEVAMINGAVVVTAKQGLIHVEGNGQSLDVTQGKTITLLPKTKAMPQAGTSQKLVGGNTALEAGALAAGGVAAILAGVAVSRAGNAETDANNAASQAAAATSAANAATSAATAAGDAANAAGCALDTISTEQNFTNPSPYLPPTGYTCP